MTALLPRFLLSLLLPALAGSVFASTDKPNIVFFLVDDMGWGDISSYDSQYHETPNLDKLRSEGMKFTQAYASCAVCSPSRASILTGRSPARLRLTDWISGHQRPKAKLSVPDWQMFVDHERVTLPEALRDSGYATTFVGKWHLLPHEQPELMDDHMPEKHGFDKNIGGREWGQPKGRGRYFYPFDMPGLEGKPGDFLTDALTDAAVKTIEERDPAKPFLLYFAYYTVHGPIMAKPELTAHFEAKPSDNPNDKRGDKEAAEYAAMIKSLDESVGRVLDTLKAQGLEKNTIIVFTSDNGGVLSRANNGPYRDGKGTPYEGGIREPLLVKYPAKIAPNSECDTPVIGSDFYPTLLDLAGLPLRPEEHKDGLSLAPLLTQSGPLQRDALFWHYPHYHKADPYGAVRYKDLKLVEYFEDGKLELYDLANDPTEQRDLAASRPEDVANLKKLMEDWRRGVGAQMMTPNPGYVPGESEWRRPKG